jgi:RNA 3'-terminal phosphate cyclase
MLHLNGSRFSGSRTIVRFGVSLATLTNQPLYLTNIRARRDPPGLRPQHLRAVEAVTQLCQGELEGAAVGSRELIFSRIVPTIPGHHALRIVDPVAADVAEATLAADASRRAALGQRLREGWSTATSSRGLTCWYATSRPGSPRSSCGGRCGRCRRAC